MCLMYLDCTILPIPCTIACIPLQMTAIIVPLQKIQLKDHEAKQNNTSGIPCPRVQF